MLKAILSAVNVGQIVTFVFMTAAPVIVHALVKDPTIAAAIISLCSSIGAALLVVLRTPSAAGGTVSTAR